MTTLITQFDAPFDAYGHDTSGRLWKRRASGQWVLITPKGFYLEGGKLYRVTVNKKKYHYHSNRKVFEEAGV